MSTIDIVTHKTHCDNENRKCAVKPVSVKRGWRYMRVCDSEHRKVSIVRIMGVNFRKNIWAFRRDKRKYLLYTGVRIKWESAERSPTVVYSYFEKGCRKKVPATIQKRVVGGFQFTDDFQRNLKERHERPWTVCCECWRKATKVGSTVTVSRNSVLIISYNYYLSGLSLALFPTTFLDMRILFAKYTPFKSHFPVFSIPIMMPIRQANLCSLQVLLNSRR